MILCCDKDNVKIHNFRIEAGSEHIKPDHLINTFFIVKEVFIYFLILLVVVNQLLDSGLMKQFSKSCLCYSRIIQFKHLSRLAWFNKTKGLIYIISNCFILRVASILVYCEFGPGLIRLGVHKK